MGAHHNTVTHCGLLLCALLLCTLQQQGRQSAGSSSEQQHVPLIKPQQQQQQAGSGKAVPDMFMLPPDEQQQRLASMKSQLLSALQPTLDTVSAVTQDSTLMSGPAASKVVPDSVTACMNPPTGTTATLSGAAGFADPEVMAAVADVARDPQAFAKHACNPKVRLEWHCCCKHQRVTGADRGCVLPCRCSSSTRAWAASSAHGSRRWASSSSSQRVCEVSSVSLERCTWKFVHYIHP